jgi:putative N6-adenine-specific DNA methylase
MMMLASSSSSSSRCCSSSRRLLRIGSCSGNNSNRSIVTVVAAGRQLQQQQRETILAGAACAASASSAPSLHLNHHHAPSAQQHQHQRFYNNTAVCIFARTPLPPQPALFRDDDDDDATGEASSAASLALDVDFYEQRRTDAGTTNAGSTSRRSPPQFTTVTATAYDGQRRFRVATKTPEMKRKVMMMQQQQQQSIDRVNDDNGHTRTTGTVIGGNKQQQQQQRGDKQKASISKRYRDPEQQRREARDNKARKAAEYLAEEREAIRAAMEQRGMRQPRNEARGSKASNTATSATKGRPAAAATGASSVQRKKDKARNPQKTALLCKSSLRNDDGVDSATHSRSTHQDDDEVASIDKSPPNKKTQKAIRKTVMKEARLLRRKKGRGVIGELEDSIEAQRIAAEEGDDDEEEEDVKDNAATANRTNARALFPPETLTAFVACQPGLEDILEQELTALGIANFTMKRRSCGALLRAPTLDELLLCHLYLGTATNVFLRIGDPIRARALGEMRRRVGIMPWKRILDIPENNGMDNTEFRQKLPQFKVKVISAKSRLMHKTAIRDHVLEGIYTCLGVEDAKAHVKEQFAADDETGQEMTPIGDDGIRLTVQLFHDKAQISIDTSATPIHQRGYRLETAKAPLREDLAYAILYSAGWRPTFTVGMVEEDPNSKYKVMRRPNKFNSFLDSFCGSGTIAIEAASMIHGLPPGRLRPAPFLGTRLHDGAKWHGLISRALKKAKTLQPDPSSIHIKASDRDEGAVQATRGNAERAGVLGFIETTVCAFKSHPWLEKPSEVPGKLLWASNLPFGRRTTTKKSRREFEHPLLPLYQSLKAQVDEIDASGCEVSSIFLTDDRIVSKQGGMDAYDAALITKHGGIPVSGMLFTNADKFKKKKIPSESAQATA